jgi:hypothetical protein
VDDPKASRASSLPQVLRRPRVLRQPQVLGLLGPQVLRQQQLLWSTRYLWETSEVTTAANTVGQPPQMSLPHRIRHCRNLQQLPQVLRQPKALGLPGPQVLRRPQALSLPGSEVLRQPQVLGLPGSAILRQPQVLGLPGPQVLRQQQLLWSTRYLWETSEVTTAANAVGQPPQMSLHTAFLSKLYSTDLAAVCQSRPMPMCAHRTLRPTILPRVGHTLTTH